MPDHSRVLARNVSQVLHMHRGLLKGAETGVDLEGGLSFLQARPVTFDEPLILQDTSDGEA